MSEDKPEENANDTFLEQIDINVLEEQLEINMHALDGQAHPHAFWISGLLNNHLVQVLIDSGSTHNFIQK